MSGRSILWFRKGLRIHDNPALLSACDGASHLQPIFVLDPWFLKPERVGVNRLRFLLESLKDLDQSLQKLGSNLLVLHGDPTEVIPKAVQAWQVDKVCWEHDIEPYARKRDGALRQTLRKAKVTVDYPSGHTLYDMEKMLEKCNGEPPTVYNKFIRLCSSMGKPANPLEAATSLPRPLVSTQAEKQKCAAEVANGFGIPSLADLGYPEHPQGTGFPAVGGETEALKRLRAQLKREGWIAQFSKPGTDPTERFKTVHCSVPKKSTPFEKAKAKKKPSSHEFLSPATTALSPYLKFGCLSPRTFYHELMEVLAKFNGKHTSPPTSLEGQLLWREFYYLCAAGTENFDKMEGNRICRQIPWNRDKKLLKAWETGQTGYPWIDAAMTQLRKEGWIHHLARHAVACFLTRGDLFVHWEEGRDVFDRDLVDADWAINNGNWMWLSCSCFFYQYFRVYGPHSFAKKYDKEGKYVKHYLPVLKNMPAKYIYEPWKAPKDVQHRAGCIIGKDYPKPIVDHADASNTCKSEIAKAYEAYKTKSPKKSKKVKTTKS